MKRTVVTRRKREPILGFGASTMQGVGDDAGGFLKRLEQHLREGGDSTRVINLGIGGNTTVDMAARLRQARRHLPARVVVLLGCNDVPRDRDDNPDRRVPLPLYKANLEKVLTALASPNSLFVSSFIVSHRKRGVRPEVLRKYMLAAMKIARSHGYRVWDLNAASRRWRGRYLAEDGMHFNPAGHALIARGVLRRLERP